MCIRDRPRWGDRLLHVNDLVEKPHADKAPSNLGVTGRYVLPPEIFDHLEKLEAGTGGEIQLTDALKSLAAGPGLWAYIYEGKTHDAGDKLGFLTVSYTHLDVYKRQHSENSELFRGVWCGRVHKNTLWKRARAAKPHRCGCGGFGMMECRLKARFPDNPQANSAYRDGSNGKLTNLSSERKGHLAAMDRLRSARMKRRSPA